MQVGSAGVYGARPRRASGPRTGQSFSSCQGILNEQALGIGPAGAEQDAGPGTDFDAIRRGAVSVTPLQIDLTRYDAIDGVAKWLADTNT